MADDTSNKANEELRKHVHKKEEPISIITDESQQQSKGIDAVNAQLSQMRTYYSEMNAKLQLILKQMEVLTDSVRRDYIGVIHRTPLVSLPPFEECAQRGEVVKDYKQEVGITTYNSINEEMEVNSLLSLENERTFEQEIDGPGNPEDEDEEANIQSFEMAGQSFPSKVVVVKAAYEVFDEMKDSFPTDVLSFAENCLRFQGMEDETALEALVWLFEEVEQSPPFKFEDVDDAHHLFDESTATHLLAQTEEKDEDYSIGKSLHGCELLGNEVGQPHLLIMRSVKADHQLFDKMPKLIAGEPAKGTEGLKGCDVSSVCLLKDLRYAAGVIRINSNKFSSKSKYELDVNFWVSDTSKFIFDPGGSTSRHKGCIAFDSNNKSVFPVVCLIDSEAANTKIRNFEGHHTQNFAVKCCLKITEIKRKMAGRRKIAYLKWSLDVLVVACEEIALSKYSAVASVRILTLLLKGSFENELVIALFLGGELMPHNSEEFFVTRTIALSPTLFMKSKSHSKETTFRVYTALHHMSECMMHSSKSWLMSQMRKLNKELRDATLIIQSKMEIEDYPFIIVVVYILEDKDDFKRVGKEMILMNIIWMIIGI